MKAVARTGGRTGGRKKGAFDTGLQALGVTRDAADLAERYGREVKAQAESGAGILPAASPLALANSAAAPPSRIKGQGN